MQSFAGSFKGRYALLQPRTFVRTVTDLSGGRSSGVTLTNESTPRRPLQYAKLEYSSTIGQRRVVGLSFGSPLAAGVAGVLSVCVLLAAAAAAVAAA